MLVQSAKRAFRETSARPSSWAALKPGTIAQKKRKGKSTAPLIRDANLIRSPRIIRADRRKVSVGSNLYYARFHQLGEGVPKRPFWPFSSSGRIMPSLVPRLETALRTRLGVCALGRGAPLALLRRHRACSH